MAWRTLRHPDRNGPGGRQAVGWAPSCSGCWAWSTSPTGCRAPTTRARCARPAASLGYISSSLLTDLLTVYVAVPLLVLLSLFGVLVVVGIPLHQIPERVRAPRRAVPPPVVIEGEVVDDPSTASTRPTTPP